MLDHWGKWVWLLRALPSHATHHLTGIVLPPHERQLLRLYFSNYAENDIVASRGTSKSFCLCSMAPALDIALYSRRRDLVVSASGFRGGKLLFEDIKRLINGELNSQKLPGPFLSNSSRNGKKVVRQEPDRWVVDWATYSLLTTVPTNNDDTLRGIRARRIVIDERNTFDGVVVQQVIRPMANVMTEFDRIVSAEEDSAIFQVGTIDYTFRDWWKEIDQKKRLMEREYEAMQALTGGEKQKYEKLMAENDNELASASFALFRVDYTDLLIPEEVDAYDGSRYRVRYPLPPHLTREDRCAWDDREERFLWYSYPVNKKLLEAPLRDGTMDEDLWRAEQRNVFITASGNVYSDELVRQASEKPIYGAGEIPGYDQGKSLEDQTKQGLEQYEFFPPVLYSCGDPCVLGVDVARVKDESSFVVFRLGELAEGKFDWTGKTLDKELRPCYGKTSWNSVIWAESWPRMTAHEVAEKIRDLRRRFNLINTSAKEEGYGGLGMDGRGGGQAVRDELSKPSAPVLSNGLPDPNWKEPTRIYDPTDEMFLHYQALDDEGGKYWSGLRLLTPSNAENWEWTRYTKAAMEQEKLFIGYWQSPSTWAAEKGITERGEDYFKWLIGYNGIAKLKKQLVKLQIEWTAGGAIKVHMPGAKGTEDALKDLYSAFIYGWQVARQHLLNTKEAPRVPQVDPVLVSIGSDSGRRLSNISWSIV